MVYNNNDKIRPKFRTEITLNLVNLRLGSVLKTYKKMAYIGYLLGVREVGTPTKSTEHWQKLMVLRMGHVQHMVLIMHRYVP